MRLNIRKRRILEGYVFLSPLLLGIIIFFAFPLYISVKLSFGDIIKITGFQIKWVGLANYIRAFVLDINFIPMFLSVIGQMLSKLPLTIVFSLILAIAVNKKIRFKGFFRISFFLPFLLGTGFIMENLLMSDVNKLAVAHSKSIFLPEEILTYLGPKVNEIINTFFGLIAIVLWNSGVQILLFLSALQSIPVSLYESAKIDGATEWEMLWKITLPMISPIMLLNIIYTIVSLMTDISNPIIYYINHFSFYGLLQFEYAAAIGSIYFAFILLLVLAVFLSMKKLISNVDIERSQN